MGFWPPLAATTQSLKLIRNWGDQVLVLMAKEAHLKLHAPTHNGCCEFGVGCGLCLHGGFAFRAQAQVADQPEGYPGQAQR